MWWGVALCIGVAVIIGAVCMVVGVFVGAGLIQNAHKQNQSL